MNQSGEIARLRAIVRFQAGLAACGLDLEEVLDFVAAGAVRLVGADRAVIELSEPTRSRIAVIGEGRTAVEREPILSIRAEGDSNEPATQLLRVPLVNRGEEVGTLALLGGRSGRFDASDLRALELVAPSIAAQISNAYDFNLEAHGSRHDGLTGLLNRRSYEERLALEIARSRRYDRQLSLSLLDLDDFKALNDSFGHPAGDAVLRQVAIAIRRNRLADRGFRVGGDEFAILMPETSKAEAAVVVERLVATMDVEAATVGISVGIVDGPADATAMHAAADRVLLAAKDRLHRRGTTRISAAAPALRS